MVTGRAQGGHDFLAPRTAQSSLENLFFLSHGVFLLEAFSSPQEASVFKHVVRVRVERPIATLSRFLVISRHLDKAFIQA